MYDFLFIWYVTGKITIRFSLDVEAKENSLCTVNFGYMQFINKKIKVCKVVDIENPVFIKSSSSVLHSHKLFTKHCKLFFKISSFPVIHPYFQKFFYKHSVLFLNGTLGLIS